MEQLRNELESGHIKFKLVFNLKGGFTNFFFLAYPIILDDRFWVFYFFFFFELPFPLKIKI